MERLFSPCTRLHDLLGENQDGGLPVFRIELLNDLILDVSTEELLSTERAFTYADLYDMLDGETVAWLTPQAAFTSGDETAVRDWMMFHYASCRFAFNADGKEICILARSPEHALELCDVVLRLLAASVIYSVSLRRLNLLHGSLISAPTCEYLMEHCQSLKLLSLQNLEMDENHCRVLGAYSRPGLEIELIGCKFMGAGTSALAAVLGRNQGPTKLFCHNDNFVLADGLRGNSRLKSIGLDFSEDCEVANRELLAIAGALKENKGIVELELYSGNPRVSLTWGAICDSLKTHPTLEVLTLVNSTTDPAKVKSRVQALLDMVKLSLSIHTIHLTAEYREHELFRGSVIPYLETNRLRPLLLAIQQTRPIQYRAKVLGRALLSARTDANKLWMLLSGNAEVAFPSTAATTTPAVNLPTPATTATNSAAVAASAMSTLTATATGSLPIAAADTAKSAATPSTASTSGAFGPTVVTATANGLKRKVRP